MDRVVQDLRIVLQHLVLLDLWPKISFLNLMLWIGPSEAGIAGLVFEGTWIVLIRLMAARDGGNGVHLLSMGLQDWCRQQQILDVLLTLALVFSNCYSLSVVG
ncbi:hypothetical protein RchiOBHm_Chr7g0184491 [Rosa chinensis]|uniref:Uncharacterized protein n=1 Tax=Rosa chinensis TaxID=74649 RepID=A0A2P6P3I0_ROSCH|nr:hypothetical protein RchiOBHm_Chr7g0184491 [Rosa chinensis]